jgi:hypothetical protein
MNDRQINDASHPANQFPRAARLKYWASFVYLSKRGKLEDGKKADSHAFRPCAGTRLYDSSMEAMLRFSESRLSKHTDDIAIDQISSNEATPQTMARFRSMNRPVLIKGGAAKWPAMNGFDLEYFEKHYGHIEVPINEEPNIQYEDDGKPVPMSNFYRMKYYTVQELVDSVRSNGNLSAKAIEDIMHVEQNRLVKEYCDIAHIETLSGYAAKKHSRLRKKYPIGKVISQQLFIQPERSHSLWHVEPGDNYFVQITGRKRWRFAHPWFTPGMYPAIKDHSTYHASRVDGRESNEVIARRGMPLYPYVPKFYAIVEPGDMLFMPNYWWHTVTNIPGSHTMSLTMRTISDLNFISPTWEILRYFDSHTWRVKKRMLKTGRLFDEDISASLFSYADANNDLRDKARAVAEAMESAQRKVS